MMPNRTDAARRSSVRPMTTTEVAPLLDRARAWAAEDPDDQTRAELEQRHRRRRGRRRRRPTWRTASTAPSSSAPPACAAPSAPAPNRMNRVVVHPRGGRPGGLPARPAAPPRGSSVVIGYDARHNSDVFARDTAEVMTGAGLKALRAAPAAAHAAAGLRDPRARLRRRRDGDRQPQPAAGQRLQGLPRRRQPDRAAGRRRDRRPDRGGRRRWPTCPRGDAGTRAGRGRSSTATSTPSPASPPTARATSTSSTRRCTASAAPRSRRSSRPPASPRRAVVARAGAARPGLPDGRVPQPRGAGRDGPRHGPRRATGADLVVANDPDADRCAAAVPGPHGWRMLRGDEVGALLAASPAARPASRAPTPPRSCRPRCSGRMAAAAGQPYVETLTGFKWIGRVDGPGLRLRGGARLLRRPRAREGQGRRLGAAAALRARRRGQGRRPDPAGPARRHRRRARPARDRPALGAGHRPRARSPPRWTGSAARRRPRSAGWPSSRSTTSPRARADLPPDRRPALPARRGRPGDRPAERHRAEAEVLPRGGRPGRDPEDGVEAARISAAGRLDALRNDIKAAAGHLSQATSDTSERRRREAASAAISGHAQAADRPAGERGLLRRATAADAARGRRAVLREVPYPRLDDLLAIAAVGQRLAATETLRPGCVPCRDPAACALHALPQAAADRRRRRTDARPAVTASTWRTATSRSRPAGSDRVEHVAEHQVAARRPRRAGRSRAAQTRTPTSDGTAASAERRSSPWSPRPRRAPGRRPPATRPSDTDDAAARRPELARRRLLGRARSCRLSSFAPPCATNPMLGR